MGEHLRDDLLIVVRVHKLHVIVHDVGDGRVRVREDELPERDLALQLAIGGGDVAQLDGLLVHAVAADDGQRVRNGHAALEADVFVRHQAARAVVRVLQVLVDKLSVFGRGVAHNALHNIGRHLLDQVDAVVEEHVVQNDFQFDIGDGFDNFLLDIGIHVRKGFRRALLREQAEQAEHQLAILDFGKQIGDIGNVQVIEQVAQLAVAALLQQQKNTIDHRHAS